MVIYKKEYFSDEVKNIEESTNKSIHSRYDSKIRLRLANNTLVIRNLKEDDLVAKLTNNDLLHRVVFMEAKRPDLIALHYYGDARLYWVILGANDLRERDQLVEGMLIRIPAINSLYGYDGLLVR